MVRLIERLVPGWSERAAELRRYPHGSEPVLRRTAAVRRAWLDDLDRLAAEAAARDGQPPARELATLGRVYRERFAELRDRLAGIAAPNVAEPYHHALVAWLDSLVRASAELAGAGVDNAPDALARCRAALAAGREHRLRSLAGRAEHGKEDVHA